MRPEHAWNDMMTLLCSPRLNFSTYCFLENVLEEGVRKPNKMEKYLDGLRLRNV